VRLFEHPDFEQAILRAADHFQPRGLRPAIIEKDYYVTEALRVIAAAEGDRAIFKGGTSLSKGWSLIERFSEDIDVFIDVHSQAESSGTKSIDGRLRRIRDAIDAHPGLSFTTDGSVTSKGLKRSDRFRYAARIAEVGGIGSGVLVETMTASGSHPTERRTLSSYLADYLRETGITLQAEDEKPFEMQLLHFRRTFVEKMFAIHAKVEIMRQTKEPIGSYARHYYDLYCLANQPEVIAMLRSHEYAEIKQDYARISSDHFPRDYIAPPDLSFARSDAIFPSADLEAVLAAEFEKQCGILCFGVPPSWQDYRARMQSLRSDL